MAYMSKNRSGIFLMLLIVVLMSGCTSSSGGLTASSTGWMQTGVIAVFIGFMVIGITYMFAHAFDIHDLQLWVKEEFYQAVFTVVIMGSIFVVVGFINSGTGALAPAFGGAGGSAASVQAAAIGYADSVLAFYSGIEGNLKSVAEGAGAASAFSSQCTLLGPWLQETLAPCMELGITRGPISAILSAVAASLLAMEAQRFLLSAAATFMIGLLFPLGILFRCFAFTRKAGGAFIAIAVGFYSIFPLMVILDSSILPIQGTSAPYSTPSEPTASASIIWSPPTSCPNGDSLLGEMANTGIQSFIIWDVIIVGVVGPVLNILVTLTFISWLSSAIGSDIEVAELARIS